MAADRPPRLCFGNAHDVTAVTRDSAAVRLALDLSQVDIELGQEVLEVEWLRQVVARAGVTKPLDLLVRCVG